MAKKKTQEKIVDERSVALIEEELAAITARAESAVKAIKAKGSDAGNGLKEIRDFAAAVRSRLPVLEQEAQKLSLTL